MSLYVWLAVMSKIFTKRKNKSVKIHFNPRLISKIKSEQDLKRRLEKTFSIMDKNKNSDQKLVVAFTSAKHSL